jgi:thiol-disulfide isomerase/thioredoxin
MPAFLSLLFPLLLLLNGCEKKEKEKNPFQKSLQHSEKNITSPIKTTKETETTSPPLDPHDTNQSKLQLPGATTYLLTSPKGESLEIAIDQNDHLYLSNKSHSIVILNFFTSWSYPCRSQLPYLVDLQKKYTQKLRIIGIVLNPHNHTDQLEDIVKKAREDLFIANGKTNNAFTRQILKPVKLPDFMPIPLTVIYHNGIYYRHYEGAVPIEMIEHDIKTIMK